MWLKRMWLFTETRRLRTCCSLCVERAHPNFFPCLRPQRPGKSRSRAAVISPSRAAVISPSRSPLGADRPVGTIIYVWPPSIWLGTGPQSCQALHTGGRAEALRGALERRRCAPWT